MQIFIPQQTMQKLDNFKTFLFLPLITKDKPNPWNKTPAPQKLRYFTKNEDSFTLRKEEFINAAFVSRMRKNVTFGVRVNNKYNGQIFGIIAIMTKYSNDNIEINWREKILNKPVNKNPSIPKGTKIHGKLKKYSYLKETITRKQIYGKKDPK